VRATGVAARHPEGDNQRAAAQLYVSSLNDIKVEEPPAPAGFSSPPKLIQDLGASDAGQRFARQMHLRGLVTWAAQGLFTIEDGSGTLFVGTGKDVVVRAGQTVDVIGFPGHGVFGLELVDSFARLSEVQQSGAGLAPLQVTAAEIIKRSLHGRRVHLRARLLGESAEATEFVYEFQEGSQHFHAVLLRDDATRETVGLAPDSVLDLTGVALLQRESPEWPESLLILIE
jgi:hypothetical protein